ncbi:DUF4394 domain-containing protein [Larkinella rosea]|uniref:DUF4394 domain-containing protein n=1 Tax=Larkinella rosea TaxID=2025312 RepID=A0A3P1BGA8_9BACT|nr:DUF4394 domain-containing protein [Larkinella rosea]RRA99842.1 DUF4394 domain-containing protein [Larkinella rosea]
MKMIHTIPFRTLCVSLLLIALQACEDHRAPVNPTSFPDLPGSFFYILTENNLIHELNIKNPKNILNTLQIETRVPGEKIVAIDFRPATGQLYALSNDQSMYSVNVGVTRFARSYPVNRKTEVEADMKARTVAFDFNPVTDRFRLITSKGENVQLDPETGWLDKDNGNPKGLATPNVAAVAYANNYSGATQSTLYGIDPVDDKLVRYENADAGTVQTVGALGLDIAEVGGFDISPKTRFEREFGVAAVRFGNSWEFDYVDLTTGKLQKLGNGPENTKIIDIAIPTPVAYAVTKENKLLSLNPAGSVDEEGDIREKTMTGLPQGVSLLGLDFSAEPFPKLYALATNSRIYEINPGTGKATESCRLNLTLNLTGDPGFGVDFDPYTNLLRVVTTNNFQFSIHVGTGQVTDLNPLTFNGQAKGLTGLAFTNSQVELTRPEDAVLYGMDGKSLYRKDLTTNALTKVVDFMDTFDNVNGFDIGGYQEMGYAVMTYNGAYKLYKIDLTTGEMGGSSLAYKNISGFTLGYNIINKNP